MYVRVYFFGEKPLIGKESFFVQTTLYFVAAVALWLSGGYFVRESVLHARVGSRKCLVELLAGVGFVLFGCCITELLML